MEIPKQYLRWVGNKASLSVYDRRIKELVDVLQSTIKIVNYLDAALKEHKHTDECLRRAAGSLSYCFPNCANSWRKARGSR